MSDGRKQIIPLCRSEFLQDFSIELGRGLRSIRRASKSVTVEAGFEEHEGRELETLTVWIITVYHTRTTITLWEDRIIWISLELLPTKNNKKFQLDFYPCSKELSAPGIVEALRDTVAVSTRLCYSESPLPTLRRIWRHEGEVNTKGSLRKKGSSS